MDYENGILDAVNVLHILMFKRGLWPVSRSLVSANCWLTDVKTYRFLWYLTLDSAIHALSNPGLVDIIGSHCNTSICESESKGRVNLQILSEEQFSAFLKLH